MLNATASSLHQQHLPALGTLWEPAMQKALHEKEIRISLHFSELKENAAIIGSARLMQLSFWKQAKPLLSKM